MNYKVIVDFNQSGEPQDWQRDVQNFSTRKEADDYISMAMPYIDGDITLYADDKVIFDWSTYRNVGNGNED